MDDSEASTESSTISRASQYISEESSDLNAVDSWIVDDDSDSNDLEISGEIRYQFSENVVESDSSRDSTSVLTPFHRDAAVVTRSHTRQDRIDEDSGNSAAELAASTEDSNTRTSLQSEASEPPAKVRKMSSPPPNPINDDGDGETCPICLDAWGNSGDHRLVSLKCGHLFGSKCVEKWIRGKNTKERSCPTCKSKASLKDIRFIYARRLVAVDTSELTALQKQLEIAQMEKNQIQMDLQVTKLECRSLGIQYEMLQKTMRKNNLRPQFPHVNDWRFALEKNLEVRREGGCRVLTFNCRTYEFYVSQKTTNNLFPGYGVRIVNAIDCRLGSFVHLHSKVIRDIAYSQPADLLMSVGLDGTARIVERGIPTTVVQCGVPLWSCAWDRCRPDQFYVGGVGGVVKQYDVRNTGAQMETFSSSGDMSPSVSLCSTEFGLLSCQLNSCWLWRPGCAEPQPFPMKGPFTSLSYDEETQRAVVSCRPRSSERARLAVFKMQRSPNGDVTYDNVHNVPGSTRSTLMSRVAWVKCPNAAWVAAYSETDSLLYLHPLEGGRTMTLPAAEATLDVCAAQVSGDTVVAALSDCRLRLYKSIGTKC